ncbi:nucleotidyl transferase AbiEii/AbiGii toxin family protein [Actinotalea sp. C106]|uniref:nucleotidyl transferase AbiEii/AbiGii toxin family protein n=1 Tax=Actinotalea sp. C106 TaxID=2908644 RepID=UPI0027DF0960|nr:nucleotidyl transferase AbiEii/AbiGii toxin family protein [Actinotalea sp. C106]
MYSRLLARVFATPDAPWVLKGGTASLMRIPDARTTNDVDLLAQADDLEAAVVELRRALEVDLGDHFHFRVTGTEPNVGGEGQPHVRGVRVKVQAYCGTRAANPLFGIDIVTGSLMTAEPDEIVDGALEVRGIDPPRVRVYPVVDHIADKLCATMTQYRTADSGRTKDLVDLVVFACKEQVDGSALTLAIHAEWGHRNLPGTARFAPPSSWAAIYPALARKTPACEVTSWAGATSIVTDLLDPALNRAAAGQVWSPTLRVWSPGPAAPSE